MTPLEIATFDKLSPQQQEAVRKLEWFAMDEPLNLRELCSLLVIAMERLSEEDLLP